MDAESLNQFVGSICKIILSNGFWYKAKILSVSTEAVIFIEAKGRQVSVSPSYITFVEEIENGH